MNELIVQENKQVSFTQEQVNVIKNQIAVGATDLELKSFIYQCERTGLDPFSRQIYFIKTGNKVQIQTSIDGFRVIAERSHKYEGQTSAQWCGEDGAWKDIWVSKDFPIAARIGVYKKGFREPLYAVAHWDEYFAQPGYMHKKMPALMLAKVAESLALRKAFPNEMGGIYTVDELPPQRPHFMDGIKEEAEIEAARMAEDAPKDGIYRVPFGSFKGRSIPECIKVFGVVKVENAINLCEEKIKSNVPYAGVTIDDMKVFIARATVGIAEFEKQNPMPE